MYRHYINDCYRHLSSVFLQDLFFAVSIRTFFFYYYYLYALNICKNKNNNVIQNFVEKLYLEKVFEISAFKHPNYSVV